MFFCLQLLRHDVTLRLRFFHHIHLSIIVLFSYSSVYTQYLPLSICDYLSSFAYSLASLCHVYLLLSVSINSTRICILSYPLLFEPKMDINDVYVSVCVLNVPVVNDAKIGSSEPYCCNVSIAGVVGLLSRHTR